MDSPGMNTCRLLHRLEPSLVFFSGSLFCSFLHETEMKDAGSPGPQAGLDASNSFRENHLFTSSYAGSAPALRAI